MNRSTPAEALACSGQQVDKRGAGSLTLRDVRKNRVYIYGLAEPKSLLVRYVGKSSNPKRRFIEHVGGSNRSSARVSHWVNGLARKGERPRLLIFLRVEPGEDCSLAERTILSMHDQSQLINTHGVRWNEADDFSACDPVKRLPASSLGGER